MAFHILDPEYDSELRYSSILGFGMYNKLSEVDLSDLWWIYDVKVKNSGLASWSNICIDVANRSVDFKWE